MPNSPWIVSKRAIWEYLSQNGKEHDTFAEFQEANAVNEDDHTVLTEELFKLFKTVSFREIAADQYMSENRPGGEAFIEFVRMAEGAVRDGYALATWYGPQTQTLIVGYNPVELDPMDPPPIEGEEERGEDDY